MAHLAGLRGQTFRSLGTPNYRRYVAGSAVSVSGTWMQRVAQDWLVLQLTDDPVALGVATALQFLPVLLAGPWAGAVVDRVDRRRLLLVTQSVQAILAVALGAVTVTGLVHVWMVYLLALLLGAVTAFDSPARRAFVAEMVAPGDVVNAQALYSSVHNGGRLVGPAVAGILIAASGVGSVFFVNAASFAAILLGLLRINPGELRRGPPILRAPGQIREALAYIWRHPELRATIILVAVIGVFGQNFRVVLPVLARETFHGGAQAYGYLTATLGLGAVVGALVTATRGRSSLRSLLLAGLAFGAANLLVAWSPALPFAFGGMVLLGVANSLCNILGRTLVLLRSPPGMQGRLMAWYGLVFLGSRPIGGPLVGWFCALWGARAALLIAGGTAALCALALAVSHRRSVS